MSNYVTIKDIFEAHQKDTIYIEEYFQNNLIYTHFSFGYKDKEKTILHLTGDGNSLTVIDATQKAWVDGSDPTLILFKDKNNASGKLRFFKSVAHKFGTVDDEDKVEKKNERQKIT